MSTIETKALCSRLAAVAAGILALGAFGAPAVAAGAPRLSIDDFEGELRGWRYVGGEEFPGAKGGAAVDEAVAHGGARSYRLRADFSGGGAYVGIWRDLGALEGRDFRELRLWVKAENVLRVGVRILDASGQCHQKNGVPLRATGGWQEVVLVVADLAGGEHWGGANDGRWHGPAAAFGLNIGRDCLAAQGRPAALFVDDVEAVLGAAIEGRAAVRPAVIEPPSCRPGFSTRITFRWEAEPMGRDYLAFVHFRARDGSMAFQSDHAPRTPTSIWSGRVEYSYGIFVPANIPDGDYRIVVGLYDKKAAARGWDHPPLEALDGAIGEKEGKRGTSCQVGVLKVDAGAPLPKLPAPTLDLSGFVVTFDEEFDDLSVSATGPGTRWFTATKETFGNARFVEQKDGFPFKVENGVLRIEASKAGGAWRSGILASVDRKGDGFSQKLGYFEIRAKFPPSLGTWPAFWLLGQPSLTDKGRTNIEIDVVEWYGVMPNAMSGNMHLWHPDGRHWGQGDIFTAPGMTTDFHDYGVMIDEERVAWYFDRIEVFSQKTPEEAKVPLYLLVNLAMGGGWPIDEAVSPSYMYVDRVRVYAKPSGDSH